MTDFVINRPDPGSPEWTMWSQDLATPPTLGQTLRAGAMETTGALQRFLEEAPYEPGIGGTLGRGMIAGGMAEGGAPPENVAAAHRGLRGASGRPRKQCCRTAEPCSKAGHSA